jgi:hypothetical protein
VAHLWLDDDRRVHEDPKMIVMRGTWMPLSWFEISAHRTVMYNGSGRPSYSGPSDWWDVITGVEDKIPGSKFDNENYVGYDMSVALPFVPKLTADILKGGRFYLERGSPDATVPWQEGQDEFRLISDSTLYGIFLTTGTMDFRAETAKSRFATYKSGKYPTGYTYRDFVIGHPLGRDGRGIYLELSRRFSDRFRATGFFIKEDHGINVEGEAEEVHEVGLDLTYKLDFMGERIELEGGGIFSRIENLDLNTDPVRFDLSDRDENEWFTYVGVRWRW